MINYELAKELKDKGFPQPEPTIGQMWFILEKKLLSSLSKKALVGTHDFEDVRHLHIIYCPTFEDIYAELPDYICLEYNNNQLVPFKMDKDVIEYRWTTTSHVKVDIIKGDIATAAAKLWLKLKEQNLLTN